MGLNKQTLVDAIAKEVELTKVQAEKALKTTIDAISKELKKGGSVTLIGFGTFSVMKRKARKGKNPRTGEVIKIAAKKVPKFKPGKALSEMVAGKRKKKK
jgi:DNA-binding protein HU-beta